MTLRNSLLAATLLALPVAMSLPLSAQAQVVNGVYVGAGAGYDYLHDFNLKNVPIGPSTRTKLTGSGGPLGLVSVGYGFGNGLRVEVEGSIRYEHERVKNSGLNGGTNISTYGGMANALYDFNLGSFLPYVGVGAGYQATQLDGSSIYTNPGVLPAGVTKFNSSTTGNFAAQGIAGVAFPIAGIPGLSLTAEYRFMAVLGNQRLNGFGTPAVGPVVPASLKLDNQYHSSALIGVRYAFGVAPLVIATAPPAPQPAATRSFLVFFDWDKSDLSARARQIIAQAAQASTQAQVTRIEVDGYTDRSGTPAYNIGLSKRRADTVAAELVRDGVPRASITTMAFGETHPLVPTAAGVREPQNRRVEILFK